MVLRQIYGPRAQCVGYSEIDSYATDIYARHFPGHVNYGDITKLKAAEVRDFDLFIAGFPCTDLSNGNVANLGLDGDRSGLIKPAKWFMDVKAPTDFVIENVASMRPKNRDALTKLLGVEPVLLNAADISAQHRERLFWASFPIPPLAPAPVTLESILEHNYSPDLVLSKKEMAYMDRGTKNGRNHWGYNHHHDTAHGRSRCLPANLHRGVPYNVLIDRRFGKTVYRKFSPLEAERLMGFPDGWTSHGVKRPISNSRRYKALGNSVSVPVVKHVFEALHAHKLRKVA